MLDLKDNLLRMIHATSRFFHAFKGNKKALFGLSVLIFFALMATFGPYVVPLKLTTDFSQRFQLPSLEHWLGTDYLGRDVFQELVHGSRDVILIAALAGFFAVTIGVIIGSIAGFMGKYVDMILMRIVDIFLTVPSFPVMMIFAATFRVSDPVSIGIILAVWSWPGLARAIRSQVLSLKEREYVEAARLLKLSKVHMLFGELVPNLMSYITVNFVRMTSGALTAGVGLMFLGLIPYSPTNWGMMLNMAFFQTGSIYVPRALFTILSPMVCIMLFQYGALNFANGLDEWFNPQLRAHE